MTTLYMGLATVLLSAVPLLFLCLGDPKRRRSGHRGERGSMGTGTRRLLAALAAIPGVACAMVGDSAAFLIWLGGCALFGWAAAIGFRMLERPTSRSSTATRL